MNDAIELYARDAYYDPIVERIHETRHRIAAYFGNDFMRMARFGAGDEDFPDDFFARDAEGRSLREDDCGTEVGAIPYHVSDGDVLSVAETTASPYQA